MGTPLDSIPAGDAETRERINALAQEIRNADIAGRAPRHLTGTSPTLFQGDFGGGKGGFAAVKDFFNRSLIPESLQALDAGFTAGAKQIVGRIPQATVDVFRTIDGDEEAKQRLVANEGIFIGSAIETAFLEPAAALIDLSADIFDVLPGELFDEMLEEYRDVGRSVGGALTEPLNHAENVALQIGMTPQEIGRARMGGELVGFVAPLTGSLKVASAITGYRGGQIGNIFGGFLQRDMLAGGIFGFTMREEDEGFDDRFKHGFKEAGYFGAFSMVIAGMPWLRANRYRNMLMREGFSKNEAMNFMQRQMNSAKVNVPGGKERTTFEMLAEENTIAQSARAQQLLREGREFEALITATKEVNPSRGGHAIIRGIKEPGAVLPRLKEQMPDVHTFFVRRKSGYDVIISTQKPLSPKQKAQFKREGLFEGMQGVHGGSEIEILRRGGKKGSRLVVIRDMDGQFTRLAKIDDIALYNTARDVSPTGAAADDTLYRSFSDWFKGKIDRIAQAGGGGGKSRAQVIDDVTQGRLPQERLRTITQSDDLLFPMDAGLTVEGNLGREALIARDPRNAISIRQVSPAEMQMPAEMAGRTFFQIERGGRVPTIVVEATRTSGGGVRISLPGGGSLAQLPRRDAKKIAEAFVDQAPSITRVEFEGMRRPIYESVETLAAKGSDDLIQLAPEPLITFEDSVRLWMKEQGIVGADAEAFVEHAAHRMRQEMLASLPAAERETLKRIRTQLSQAQSRAAEDLAFNAKLRGFDYRELSDGRVLLRDINSGAEIYLGGKAGAREALRTGRPTRDAARGQQMPTGFASTGSPHAPERSPAGNFILTATDDSIAALFAEQGMPKSRWFTNIRDALVKFESRTGFPIFTDFFDDLFKGMGFAKTQLTFDAHKLQKAVRGLSQSERYDFVKLWERTLGKDMTEAQIRSVGRELGLSQKQIRAAEDVRVAVGHDEFLLEYYTRVQPAIAEGKTVTREAIYGNEPVPPFMDRFFRHTKTGEIEAIDRDPLVVALKWRKNEAMETHAGEAWDRITSLTGFGRGGRDAAMKIGDLPLDQQLRVTQYLRRNGITDVGRDTPLIPEPFAKWINEQLGRMRGYPELETGETAKLVKSLLEKVGVNIEERVLTRLVGDLMSTWYGSLLATPKAVTRNIVDQTLYFDYGRYGAKHLGEAFERAMTKEGFMAAVNDGAIRLTEGGLPIWDALMTDLLATGAVEGSGLIGRPLAAAIRNSLKVGQVSRGLSSKLLTPYTTADDFNRARSYWNARLHARENITRWQAGKIDDIKLGQNALPGASPEVQRKFVEHVKLSPRTGEGYAGRIMADENHFMYSMSTQPAMLQTSWGQFLGMFSSWPLWAKEMYKQRMMNMTFAQRSAFIARNAAVSGAIGLVGYETGHDLWSWIAPIGWLNYSGGPGFDFVEQGRNLTGGSLDRRARAAQLMVDDFGRMMFPGQTAARTITNAFADSDDPAEIAFSIFLGKPTDRGLDVDFSTILDERDKQRHEALRSGMPSDARSAPNIQVSPFRGSPPLGQGSLPPGFSGATRPASPPREQGQPLIPSRE